MKKITREIIIKNEASINFPLLPNGNGWRSSENDGHSVLESGPGKVLLREVIKAIGSARQMICLQSFLIQDSELIDALVMAVNERNVRVFLLSSADARLKNTVTEDDDTVKDQYIKLLETKFRYNFVHRSSSGFHAKYILVDPLTDPKGFLCTNNFTENGFCRNPELAVRLDKQQCIELYEAFVYHFWEHSTDEQTATNEFDKVKPAGRFSSPAISSILLTSPEKVLNTLSRELLHAIKAAESSIAFSTYQLDNNLELLKAIVEKARQGISVTLFCRSIEKQFEQQLKQLLENNVAIYFHPLLHAKSMLIDQTTGFIFTANLQANGLEHGFEAGVKLDDQQAGHLARIHSSWRNDFPYKAVKEARIRDLAEYYVFKNGNISKMLVLERANREESVRVLKVADLFAFYNTTPSIKDHTARAEKVKLTADLDPLPEKIISSNTPKFDVLEVEDEKKKLSKIVVIKDDFLPEDLQQLEGLKASRVYFK